MRNTEQTTRKLYDLAPMVLLGLFALCILTVLFMGAGVYRDLVQQDRQVYAQRTCAGYLSARIRQAPSVDAVTISDFGGGALVITEEIGGTDYCTRIYCHDGWLMELYAATDGEFVPEDGEKLLEARTLELKKQDDLLEIIVTAADGSCQQLAFALDRGTYHEE